jgi:GT2 family glycosyltransferase
MIKKRYGKARDHNKRGNSLRLGYKHGYSKGYNVGFDSGFIRGYDATEANFAKPFEGTSIIIPTYNQNEYLQKCIESIQHYTKEPYELIVVDNASSDGTRQYLTSMRAVIRIKINEKNIGFAGAVNQGLRMAGGTTLLILNNDTVVTTNWLSNLLTCVNSNSKFGLVGPTTNYIGGDQQIPTSYDTLDSMHEFARSHNQSDPGRWKKTSRLIGFCVMMRRDVFERLGYFDEGFEIGNCEDDDYGLRAQLLGMDLIIAEDTFIHHFGSVSMKSLGSEFDQVYNKNLTFYAEKWGDPHSLLANVLKTWEGASFSSIDFYPTHVLVKGMDSTVYWLENGVSYPIENGSDLYATRISDMERKQLPEGAMISKNEVLNKANELNSISFAEKRDGILAVLPDGQTYQYQQGQFRRFNGDNAPLVWVTASRNVHPLTFEEKASLLEGMPILSPPMIRSHNL